MIQKERSVQNFKLQIQVKLGCAIKSLIVFESIDYIKSHLI